MSEHYFSRRNLLRGMIGVAATMAMAPLVACAPKAQPTAAPTTAPKAEPTAVKPAGTAVPAKAAVQIRLMARAGFSGDGQREFAKRFMAQNPGVTVKVEDITYADIFTKSLALAAVGDLQDVIFGHSRWSPYCAYKGLFLDLDPLVKVDSEKVLDIYFPSVMADMRGLGTSGKLFYLPEYIDASPSACVYMNLDLLDAAGFAAPKSEDWTFADLEQMARKTTNAAKKVYGLIGGNVISKESGLQAWTRGWGKPGAEDSWALSKDGKTICLGDKWPVVKQAMQWWWQLTKDKVVATTADLASTDEGLEALFNNGQAAMYIQDTNAALDRDKTIAGKFKWTAVLKPLGPNGNRGSCVEAGRFSVNAQTKAPNESYKLAKMLTGYDCAVWTAMNLKRVPHAVVKAWADPQVLALNMMWPPVAKWLEKGADPYPTPANLRGNELRDIITNQLTAWHDAKETWEEMIAHAQPAIQKLLDQPMP